MNFTMFNKPVHYLILFLRFRNRKSFECRIRINILVLLHNLNVKLEAGHKTSNHLLPIIASLTKIFAYHFHLDLSRSKKRMYYFLLRGCAYSRWSPSLYYSMWAKAPIGKRRPTLLKFY